MSTALQTTEAPKPLTIRDRLQSAEFKAAVSQALPKHITPERQIRTFLTAITRTPKLAQCDQASFFKSCMDLTALGLEADGRRAHLIPYGTTCTLVIDYKGLVELAMRSGALSNIHADVVRENDVFEYDRGELKAHKIDFRKPRGEVFAVYAIARFKDGGEKCEVMGKDEVELIRKRSPGGKSGAWVSDWTEMAKKTVFRRLSKWLPLSPEFRDALEIEDAQTPISEPPALTFAKPFELPAETIDAAPVSDVDGGAS